jgi:hypothetical protein
MPTTASHVWRPSSARTLALDSFVPVPRGTIASAPAPLSWPIKDPADVLDYVFDISAATLGNQGDGISTLDVSISPTGSGALQLRQSTADGNLAVLWLAGGNPGVTYTVTLDIGTTNGRIIARDVLLPVLALSTPLPASPSLTTNAGEPITDQANNPLTVS